MRPTFQGLLFRTFRRLFLLTLILGFLSALLSALHSLDSLPPAPAGTPDRGGSRAPVSP